MTTLVVFAALLLMAVLGPIPRENVSSGEGGIALLLEDDESVAPQLRDVTHWARNKADWENEFLGGGLAVPVSGPVAIDGKSYLPPHLDRSRAELGDGVWSNQYHSGRLRLPQGHERMSDKCLVDFGCRVPNESSRVADSSHYTLRDPIFIHGDDEFTVDNGVTGGGGTVLDPYVIEGWEINASSANGIRIVETDVHFIIRDVYVHSGTDLGISFAQVANGRVENSISSTNLRYGIDLSSATNVTLSGNLISNNGRGIRLWTSLNVTLRGNTVSNSRWEGIEFTASSSVTLKGNTVTNNSHGIHLSSSPDVIFTENNISSNHWDGIHLSSSSDAILTGNHLSDNGGDGVELSESTRATLAGNIISDNGEVGILLWRSARAAITDNTIADNRWDGVYFSGSPRATVTGNTFTSNGVVIYGWLPRMEDYVSHTITPDNLVNGLPLHYFVNSDGIEVDGIPVGQLIVANCRDVRIANLEIAVTGVGIQMAFVDGALVTGSSVTDNRNGIHVLYSTDVTISGSDISNNSGGGIHSLSSTNITVSGNAVSTNGGDGVELYSSSAIIANNKVSDNSNAGIAFERSSSGSVTDNILSDNAYGIIVSTSAARVVQNGFLFNEVQASVEGGAENTWDNGYPAGGNYWADHTGEDNCSGPNQDVCPNPDGILDSPYIIDSANRDRYPLVALEIPPPDSQVLPWGTVTVGVAGGGAAAAIGILLLLRSRSNRKTRGRDN